jgi:uncharacterized protein YndB with AHSA1/START domain
MVQTTDAATTAKPLDLTVTRLIDAPRMLVFKAWTQPEHAARWWGPKGFTTISCQMDARPGGHYRTSMRSPSGSIHIRSGVYKDVTNPERIVLTFGWEDDAGRVGHETIVTVTFEDLGARTRLTLHQAFFETERTRNEHVAGWASCLERLAEYMASDESPKT